MFFTSDFRCMYLSEGLHQCVPYARPAPNCTVSEYSNLGSFNVVNCRFLTLSAGQHQCVLCTRPALSCTVAGRIYLSVLTSEGCKFLSLCIRQHLCAPCTRPALTCTLAEQLSALTSEGFRSLSLSIRQHLCGAWHTHTRLAHPKGSSCGPLTAMAAAPPILTQGQRQTQKAIAR